MSALIDELKEDHKQLTSMLSQVQNLGVGTEEGRKLLFSVKDALMAHLKKEADRFYPILHKASEKDENLKSKLDTFAKDMLGISKAVSEFYEKYSASSSGLDFAREIGRMLSTLSDRIRREETMLYPEYDKIRP